MAPPATAAVERAADRLPGDGADLLALKRMVGNRAVPRRLGPSVARRALIQCANPADQRLPADQAKALALAAQAKTDIDTALANLATDAPPERRNTAEFVTQQALVPRALTPRHDSPVGAPRLTFFPGQNDYTGSQCMSIWIRARQHANVAAPLATSEITDRLMAAVSEWRSRSRLAPVGSPDRGGPGARRQVYLRGRFIPPAGKWVDSAMCLWRASTTIGAWSGDDRDEERRSRPADGREDRWTPQRS